MSGQRVTRREIIKWGAYLAPIVLTVQANFSFASAGSGDYTDNDKKDKKEKKGQRRQYVQKLHKS